MDRRGTETTWEYLRPDGTTYAFTPPDVMDGDTRVLDRDGRVVMAGEGLGGLWRWWTRLLVSADGPVFLVSDSRFVAEELGLGAIDVAVASTGLIGVRLPMEKLTAGVTAAAQALTEDGGADAARAILDGHILLSRRVADSGLYPAIDLESSVSRVVQDIADDTWRLRIRKLKRLLSAYTANRDLIAIGAYQRGSDPATDEALARWPEIVDFLGQDVHKASDLTDSLSALQRLVEPEN